jgi:hypothetical protein
LHAGIPDANRLFDLLMDKVPSARHVHSNDLIAALADFAPRGKKMRELLDSMLRASSHGRTVGDLTGMFRAGEVFADYFRDDQTLRSLAIGAFNANPTNAMATGALVELLLRENNRDAEDHPLAINGGGLQANSFRNAQTCRVANGQDHSMSAAVHAPKEVRDLLGAHDDG